MSAAEVATFTRIARPVAAGQDRGRRVTGSMRVLMIHFRPITAQAGPERALGARRQAVALPPWEGSGRQRGHAESDCEPAAPYDRAFECRQVSARDGIVLAPPVALER